MISTILDYLRLRRKGLTPLSAWKYSIKLNVTEIYLFFYIILIFFFAIVVNDAIADNEFKLSNARYSALNAQLSTKAHIAIANKLELAVIACLNGESLRVDGIDRPCKVGEYRDGKDVF